MVIKKNKNLNKFFPYAGTIPLFGPFLVSAFSVDEPDHKHQFDLEDQEFVAVDRLL